MDLAQPPVMAGRTTPALAEPGERRNVAVSGGRWLRTAGTGAGDDGSHAGPFDINDSGSQKVTHWHPGAAGGGGEGHAG